MQRKLGVVAECIVGANVLETLEKIKAQGFGAFFSWEQKYDLQYVSALKDKATSLGLDYEFIHGPFFGINEMWTAQDTPRIFAEMKTAIDSASAAGVKTVITHVSSGFTPPPVNDLGLKRFDEWVEYAEKKGVILAFENLRKLGNLACLMDRYENNAYAKYCYDCGHEHCYTVNVPFPDIYGDRLICTHIHDNLGQDKTKDHGGDLHLLPFDGNVDYARMMQRLNKANYTGVLMLEVSNANYREMSAEAFLATAYERIEKISKL